MSWWGRGSSKDDSGADAGMGAEKTDMALGADGFTADPGGSFGASGPDIGSALPRGGGGGGGAPATQQELQRMVMAEQQKALVQQVIGKLTEVSFDACVHKPDGSLSASERNCIHTVVGKYLDTSEFVMGRAQKKAEQANMLQ